MSDKRFPVNVDASKKDVPCEKGTMLEKASSATTYVMLRLRTCYWAFWRDCGDALSRKNQLGQVKVTPDFPTRKQEIFPFAVPYLLLPLLPSSRNDLVRISHLLTKCELFPWKLQNIKLGSKNKRGLKITVDTIARESEQHKSTTAKEYDKAALQIFVPASSWRNLNANVLRPGPKWWNLFSHWFPHFKVLLIFSTVKIKCTGINTPKTAG